MKSLIQIIPFGVIQQELITGIMIETVGIDLVELSSCVIIWVQISHSYFIF